MKHENTQMDERQLQINRKAMCWGGGFLALCVIIAMICKIVTKGDIGWEFFSLIGACAVIGIASHFLGDVQEPKDLFMKPLPAGSSKSDRKARKINYVLESLIFATVCTVMETLFFIFAEKENSDLSLVETLFPGFNPVLGILISAVISFAITFGLSYLVDYLHGEKFTVPRYNKMLAELDSDEDDA